MNDWLLELRGLRARARRDTARRSARSATATSPPAAPRPSRPPTASTTPAPTSPASTTAWSPRSPAVAVENESLVNVPNWLPLTFRVDRRLLVRRGRHRGRWRTTSSSTSAAGSSPAAPGSATRTAASSRSTQRRFVSMRDPHLAGLETTLVAENWSGRLEVRSALDGTVRNAGVARYAAPRRRAPRAAAAPTATNDEVVCLHVETNQSHIRIAEAARTRLFRDGERLSMRAATSSSARGTSACSSPSTSSRARRPVVEKIVALFTSRDTGISEPGEEACDLGLRHGRRLRRAARAPRGELAAPLGPHPDRARHRRRPGAASLHLHLFHLLADASRTTRRPRRRRAGPRPARRGLPRPRLLGRAVHLPVPQPAAARSSTRALLLYRYRRLDQARRQRRRAGFAGAMFPWQSGSNGREETQTMHLNPESGRWLPDASHLQRHVNAAIAYNVWQYFQATGDLEFLRFCGAEMMLEIARFWASVDDLRPRARPLRDQGRDGPRRVPRGLPRPRRARPRQQRLHERHGGLVPLPGASTRSRLCPRLSAAELRERLRSHRARSSTAGTTSAARCGSCFHDGGASASSRATSDLEELDWDALPASATATSTRLDRILEAEGDTPEPLQAHQAGRRADAVLPALGRRARRAARAAGLRRATTT